MSDDFVQELSTGIVVLDADCCVVFMNSAAQAALGVSQRRASGHRVGEFVPGFEEVEALCVRALNENKSFGREVTLSTALHDGVETEIALRASPLSDSDATQLLIEFFDITQRQHMTRENAMATQHGVSRRMIQQLAHEIRNPLGGLRGAAQLLERELSNADQRDYTRVIIREADRLAALMDGLLGPSHLPSKKTINVHEVLEHVAKIAESESPRLLISRDYDPSLPEFAFDRDQLTQALLNLVRNAAQATDSRGRIVLRTRVLTNAIMNQTQHRLIACIEVQDDGPGVAEDVAETLFYPLVTSREDGTGLGLPLAQEVVNRHGGMIEYDSTPGLTVFTVMLPIDEVAG